MTDFSKLQSIIAPLATPAAPALMLGNNLYSGMLNAGIPQAVALIGAFTATVGMELSGMLMCSMALKAFRRQAFGVMWLAVFGALVYAMFVFFGIYTAKNAGTFATMVFITLIAYLGSGIYQYFQDMTGETELGIKETDAQRKLANAQARLAKAQTKVSGDNPKVSESFGTDWRHVPQAEREKIATMTTKQISVKYRVSERTALNWQSYAKGKVES